MQREPVWAAIANLSFQCVIWFYLFEKSYPQLPLWWNTFYSQLGWGIMLAMYLVRTWKLYIDSGLAHERVQNKFGWFVAHRHYRQRKFLMKFVGALVTFHVLMVPILFLEGEDVTIPAREATKQGTALVFGAIVLAYFTTFGVFACKLRGLRDGFYIKTELGFVGVGGMFMVILWLSFAALSVPCMFPSCSVLILWFVAMWMFLWSIAFPLFIASRDPRFGVLKCFQKKQERQTTTASNSRGSTREEVSDFRESSTIEVKPDTAPADAAPLSVEKLARLKHVTLAKFLTYPPGREAFRTFTVLEFSVENLLFVEAVKELGSRVHTVAEVRALHDRFVVDSAPNQVNLPSVVVQRVKARVAEEDCDAKVFEEAVEHIFKVMQRDTYKRFQKTPEWAQCVRVFEAEERAKRGKSAEVPATTVEQPKVEVVVASPTLSIVEPEDRPSHELDNKDLPDSPTPTPSPRPTAEDPLM